MTRFISLVLIFISTSVFSVNPLISDENSPLSPRTKRVTKSVIQGEFPNFYEFIPQEQRQELVQKSFASILNSLRIPYVLPDTQELSYDRFFDQIHAMVIAKDPEAKVYIAGGMVRSLLGFVYYKLYKGFEKAIAENSAANTKFSVQDVVVKTMNKLIKNEGKLDPETKLSQPKTRQFLKALGINSDFDILIDFGPAFDEKEKDELLWEVTNFINSAESFLKLREEQNIKKSIVPVGDVKEYQKQLGKTGDRSAVQQGGLSLDWLAFDINGHSFRHPDEHPEILEEFMKGILSYLPSKNNDNESSDKQIIRALRPLLEVPAAGYDAESQDRLIKEFTRLEEKETLDSAASEQKDKMIRNARFEGAHNRFANPKTVIAQKAKNLSQKLQTSEGGAALATEFLPNHPLVYRSGDKGDLKKDGILIDYNSFIKDYTDNGVVYHGTGNITNVLNMIRNGFVRSIQGQQGSAKFGSGLYTTKSQSEAEAYAGGAGIVIPLEMKKEPSMRIIDINTEKNQKFIQDLTEQNPDREINDILATTYDVDVIINTHNIVQNAAILKMHKEVKTLIEAEFSVVKKLKRLEDLQDNFFDMLIYTRGKQIQKRYDAIIDFIQMKYIAVNPHGGKMKLYAAMGGIASDELYKKLTKLTENFLNTNNKNFPKKYSQERYNRITAVAEKGNWPASIIEAIENNKLRSIPPLYTALQDNNIEATKKWLENGANPNEHTALGKPFLMLVIENNQTEIAKLLIENSANVNRYDEFDETLYEKALINKNEELAELLKKYGAKTERKTKAEKTPLVKAIQEYVRSKTRDISLVEKEIKATKKLDEKLPSGNSLLGFAIDQQLYELAKLLLEHGASVNEKAFDRVTPLRLAQLSNQPKMVELLLNHNADPNEKDEDMFNTLIFWALDEDQKEIVKLLVKKSGNIDKPDWTGNIMLTSAVLNSNDDNFEQVKILIESGANINAKKSSNETALLYALKYRKNKVAQYLLDNKADPNTLEKNGNTMLHVITENQYGHKNDDIEQAQMLIKAGADINKKNDNQETPLHAALLRKAYNISKVLVENGAALNEIDNKGRSPLDIAVTNGNSEIAEFLLLEGAKPHNETIDSVIELTITD